MKRLRNETAKEILTKVRQEFAYDLSWEGFQPHWLPVAQPQIIGYKGEYIYIEIKLFEKYKDEIFKIFFASGSVYEIGKDSIDKLDFDDIPIIEKAYYNDTFFVSQNIKRAMYFFHEGTVTFAGKHFLHKIKSILDDDKHLLNRAWWHDLPCNQKM